METEELCDATWTNLSLQEKVEALEKIGYEIKEPNEEPNKLDRILKNIRTAVEGTNKAVAEKNWNL